MTVDSVIPASLIPQIKEALIKLGYATPETPLEFIQDWYFKYIVIRHTGFNPLVPYSRDLLPQAILDTLQPEIVFSPMLVTPSSNTITINSFSSLEIDWGDGEIQTVKTGDDSSLLALGLVSNKYAHTYADSYIDKQISIKHIDGKSPIQFFSSDAIKEVNQWYSEGYQAFELVNAAAGLTQYLTFFGLGQQLERVPSIAPPKTTDLSGLFYNTAVFNQPLDTWDISNVTNLGYTFTNAQSFNQPLNNWDVSKVNSLYQTFNTATAFDQPLNNWDTGSVTDMTRTFSNTIFNRDISMWDTSNVTAMAGLFYGALYFSQDISQWCVPLIASLPSNFATGAALFTTDKHPVWGTCPRGENLAS